MYSGARNHEAEFNSLEVLEKNIYILGTNFIRVFLLYMYTIHK